MGKIKLAFFTDMLIEGFDGCARTIHHIINRVPRDEFEIVFFCGVKPVKENTFKYVEVKSVHLPFNKGYQAALPIFSKRLLQRELADFQPDIVHVSNPSMLGSFGVEYAKKNQLPLVAIYHTHFLSYVKYYLENIPFLIPFAEKMIARETAKIYGGADINYVPVQSIIDDLKAHDINTANAELWPRGINRELFNPSKKDTAWIRELTGNDRPNIIFISRLVWEKNLRTLINIYQEALDQNLDYNFIIAGNGHAEAEVKKKMPKAIFLGHQSHENLARLYASGDVFIFPSDTESYGNVVIESMASGTPVIAANGGGPSSIITNGENGFLVPTNEVQAYLNKIKSIIEDRALKDRLIKSGLEYVKDMDWDKLTNRYFENAKALVVKNRIKA